MLFHQKNTKHSLKISPGQSWTTLHCQNDRLGAPDRTYERSIASCCLLPTYSVLANSVTVSIAVEKMGVVLCQWTVLMGYLTILLSQHYVRRYQKHIIDDHFFFQEDSAQAYYACNSPIEWKMWFSCLPVLPDIAEAQVNWCGIVKWLLIAYFISNISAKNIKIHSCVSKLYQAKGWTFFETRCICCRPCGRLSWLHVSFWAHVNIVYHIISVCLSSVTLVQPTQAVVIFGNISMPFGTLAIRWHAQKILWRSSQGNPSVGEVKPLLVAKYSDFGPIDSDFGPIEGYISETVQDTR